ncbi:unnamed protein product [Trifolium pratense]|uniref:Uncharacterized protein n=3 Tax=Trifolium pratense TaxID=57577 RepID=A0ACB0KJR4_TRIPR|nr:unnamed protein product [Trifolium pratense]CAJ2656796.1 unnamed protein product [Trifolium pratense]CAJ2656822.1 unnamed protein product [Trifolium pratense]
MASEDTVATCVTLLLAIETRDTIAKFIYASLFLWLGQQVNKSLAVGEKHTEKFISILAFYGSQPFQYGRYQRELLVEDLDKN